jgi:ApbE superfamily uncharacterized protein (UPF0280 family)
MYKERTYRNLVKPEGLVSFEAVVAETDLFISAEKYLKREAVTAIFRYRQDIESYIKTDRRFLESLDPIDVEESSSEIVRAMARAARKANVGPMASVAGAVAERVGRELLKYSREIIVENGGDIFLKTDRNRTMGIFAGDNSPFTGKLAIEIPASPDGLGVSTSSGTVSHSLSFGNADSAVIISEDTALSDAVATATGNRVKTASDIEKAIAFARSVEGVKGVLVIVGDKIGSWGDIRLV